MAKDKSKGTDKVQGTGDNGAQGAAEATENKRTPSRLATEAKALLAALGTELKERLPEFAAMYEDFKIEDLLPSTYSTLVSLSDEISQTMQRGLPLATRLANAQADIDAHWATMPIVDGKAVPDADWQAKASELLKRKDTIQRQADRKEKEKAAPATA